MCMGATGMVVAIGDERPGAARVEIGGVVHEINVSLLEAGLEPGDRVLVHLGFALEKLGAAPEAEAWASRKPMDLASGGRIEDAVA